MTHLDTKLLLLDQHGIDAYISSHRLFARSEYLDENNALQSEWEDVTDVDVWSWLGY